MSQLNTWNHQWLWDQALNNHLSWTSHIPLSWSDSDMNNWVSVEWGFQDYSPTTALVSAGIEDFIVNILGISSLK